MTIGINNIFTIVWFILMLGCGGVLSYISIDKEIFTSDLFFIANFFVGLFMLITIGVTVFFLMKFRFLIIKGNRLISFNPFILRVERIDLNRLKNIKWTSWELKATVFRTIEFQQIDGDKFSISDIEFENFDNLIKRIPKAEIAKNKFKVDDRQAKSNVSQMTFAIWVNLALMGLLLLMNISGKGYHWIHIVVYLVIIILVYASQKRRIKYKMILKNGAQHGIKS